MTAAYHPTAAELDAIRRDPTCDARADDEVRCTAPAVAVLVDSRGHAFPTCEDHMVNLYGFRFIHLSDLMGEPQ